MLFHTLLSPIGLEVSLFWTELLRQYHSAVVKRQTAERDWTSHRNSPEMAQKQQKAEEIKKQLKDIDQQLGEDYVPHFSVFVFSVRSNYLVFFLQHPWNYGNEDLRTPESRQAPRQKDQDRVTPPEF